MASYSIRPGANAQSAILSFTGILDESCDFLAIQLRDFRDIEIDMSAVERINSRGIRQWMAWVGQLDRSKRYSLKGLPRALATHANMLKDILPSWLPVQSVEVPYFCEDCGTAFKFYLDLLQPSAVESVSEVHECPKCKSAAELDVRPEIYFRFLQNRAPAGASSIHGKF